MIFPTLVYKCPGPHKKTGKLPTYDYRGAADMEQFDALIAKGWAPSYPEAIEKAGEKAFDVPIKKTMKRPKKVKPKRVPNYGYPAQPMRPKVVDPVSTPAPTEAPEIEEAALNAPPTRAELEQKANELGIKFDGRTTDKKLAAKIAEAV